MTTMKILVLHGPNLNLLGIREPAIYGTTTLLEIEARTADVGQRLGATVVCAQSNSEGALVDQLHAWRGVVHGVVVNAGAYTHTSLALRDAFAATALPFIEVHLSNIHAREPERHRSLLASGAIAVVCGLGAYGYEVALEGLVRWLRARPA